GRGERSSVYVKGFGDEEPSTQFDLEAFFTAFGPINAVRLRRTPEKFFKGSVFVEFQDEETAENFVALDPKPQWRAHDLKTVRKRDYVDEKARLIREGKLEPSSGSGQSRFFEGSEGPRAHRGGRGSLSRGGGGGRGRGSGKDHVDPDDW